MRFTLFNGGLNAAVQSECGRGEKAAFNYDAEDGGATQDADGGRLASLQRRGYAINQSRHIIARAGDEAAFRKAKSLLQRWRHFQLGWAFVPSSTRIQPGETFCVCSRELVTWIVNPLRIRYVQQIEQQDCSKAVYAFGSGTLQGHLLAGEERFAVEWNKEDGNIWYEVLSFSKPAHILSSLTYPYVKLKQRLFAQHTSQKMIQEMSMT